MLIFKPKTLGQKEKERILSKALRDLKKIQEEEKKKQLNKLENDNCTLKNESNKKIEELITLINFIKEQILNDDLQQLFESSVNCIQKLIADYWINQESSLNTNHPDQAESVNLNQIPSLLTIEENNFDIEIDEDDVKTPVPATNDHDSAFNWPIQDYSVSSLMSSIEQSLGNVRLNFLGDDELNDIAKLEEELKTTAYSGVNAEYLTNKLAEFDANNSLTEFNNYSLSINEPTSLGLNVTQMNSANEITQPSDTQYVESVQYSNENFVYSDSMTIMNQMNEAGGNESFGSNEYFLSAQQNYSPSYSEYQTFGQGNAYNEAMSSGGDWSDPNWSDYGYNGQQMNDCNESSQSFNVLAQGYCHGNESVPYDMSEQVMLDPNLEPSYFNSNSGYYYMGYN